MPPLPETSAPPAPPIGLTPLPSVEQVQQAAPGGRADHLGLLVGVEVKDPTTGLTLKGVLLVGDQKRAIVTTLSGSGVICVGADGLCGEVTPLLLPTG